MKHTREELSDMLDELGYKAVDLERYRNNEEEREYEEHKEKILNIFDELMKGE